MQKEISKLHKQLKTQLNNYSLVFLMNNIIICHFQLSALLRIIANVDEGHHLNVLRNINIRRITQDAAYVLPKEQAREKS